MNFYVHQLFKCLLILTGLQSQSRRYILTFGNQLLSEKFIHVNIKYYWRPIYGLIALNGLCSPTRSPLWCAIFYLPLPPRHLSDDCCHHGVSASKALGNWDGRDWRLNINVRFELSYKQNKSRLKFIPASVPNCLVQISYQREEIDVSHKLQSIEGGNCQKDKVSMKRKQFYLRIFLRISI